MVSPVDFQVGMTTDEEPQIQKTGNEFLYILLNSYKKALTHEYWLKLLDHESKG
jgi:hypothetical protein